ncbi:hypothetical protein WA556_005400 [Blastocystis sp. ATCC 50177/Nand II]
MAYRCELTQKYSQAATGYLDFLTEGILFLEEHKLDLPANLYNDMKRLLGAANERMEMLKRRGYTPRTQNPAPANAVHTSVPSPTPAASPKPAASGNPSHPVANSPAEQVQPASPTSQSSIRYDPNDAYEKMVVENVLDSSPSVKWEDIAGMKYAKKVLYETVILPSKRPDLFTGLRAPPKGILLFGPPGTGKTMLAKAVATESSAVFFSISSSSLTSKWVGESEKIVRALFKVAYKNQPSIVFIDEIDSVLTARSDNENEASRRLKTEFMIQLDGAATSGEERVLIMGATNRPFELDDAVIRRMARRIYIPLPDEATRYELFKILLKKQKVDLSKEDMVAVLRKSELYSGSDIKVLCKEAAMGPIREVTDLMSIDASKIRPIQVKDFEEAFRVCAPSVSQSSLKQYITWNDNFGSKGEEPSENVETEIKGISSAKDLCRSY